MIRTRRMYAAAGALGLVLAAASGAAFAAGHAGHVAHVAHVASTAASRRATAKVYLMKALILQPNQDFRNGPELSPGSFPLPADTLVRMTIVNYDDGAGPAPAHTRVEGVVGGAIQVDGKTVRAVNPNDIAHTFTISALGLNVPIPAAPTGGETTVTFEFKTPGPGVYMWQCFDLCGDNIAGWGYPMTGVTGMMNGYVTFTAPAGR